MPNPSMRAARAPAPVFTTDADGNRVGDRPQVGPASAQQVHDALTAQDAIAKQPRPVAQSQVGATPASPDTSDNPTKDLRVSTAANRIQSYGGKLAQSIDEQSQ